MTLECDDGLVFFATSYFYDADKSNLTNAHAAARWLVSGLGILQDLWLTGSVS